MGRGPAVVVALAVALGASSSGAETPGRFWKEARHRARGRSSLTRVATKAMPSVVAIATHSAPTTSGGAQDPAGLGAGFVISPDGYILTSQHVIDGAAEIAVQLWIPGAEVEEAQAKLVGEDKATDTALLKVDVGRRLPALRLGSASDVQLADWVVVIGNPFGLAQSVTVGVVSYKDRSDIHPTGAPGYLDYLQTDASINPGNSGGPILDEDGEVVAIANAVNVSGQGIGFGIPIDVAKAVLPQLKRHGAVKRSWLGLSVEDLTPELSQVFHARPPGVLISEVVPGGPAWKSGLQAGDLITAVDAARVSRAQALRWDVTTREVGRMVRLTVVRDGKAFTTGVTLVELPADQLLVGSSKGPPKSP